jgi:hypothetical protein
MSVSFQSIVQKMRNEIEINIMKIQFIVVCISLYTFDLTLQNLSVDFYMFLRNIIIRVYR